MLLIKTHSDFAMSWNLLVDQLFQRLLDINTSKVAINSIIKQGHGKMNTIQMNKESINLTFADHFEPRSPKKSRRMIRYIIITLILWNIQSSRHIEPSLNFTSISDRSKSVLIGIISVALQRRSIRSDINSLTRC